MSPNSLRGGLLAFLLSSSMCFAQVVTGRIARTGWRPTALALYETGQRLFAYDTASRSVLAFDSVTLEPRGTLALGFEDVYKSSMAVDESLGKLYVGCFCAGAGPLPRLAVLDARSLSLLKTLETSGFTQLAHDEERDAVYASYNGGLARIDVATDAVAPIEGMGGNVLTSMAVHPVTHELFVGNWSQHDGVLAIVDPRTLAVTKVPNLAGMGVTLNWRENKAYLNYCQSAGFEGACIYDRDTGAITRFYSANDSTQAVYDPATNRVHTSVEINRASTIVDGATDAWFNVSFPGFGGNSALAASPFTGRVYYVMPDEIHVMDGGSARILATLRSGSTTGGITSGSAVVGEKTGAVYLLTDDETETITAIDDRTSTWILPSSARQPGLGGAFYTTDLTVSNNGSAPADFTVAFLGHDTDGRGAPESSLSLGAGQTATYADVLGSVFGLAAGWGAIRVTSHAGALSVSGQTSTQFGDGSFGQSVPGATFARQIRGSGCSILGVGEDERRRTNLVLANATLAPLDVDVSAVSDSGVAAGSKRYSLPPLGMTQVSGVLKEIAPELASGRLAFSTAGDGFATYASVIDNATNDPRTLLPACAAPTGSGGVTLLLPSSARAPGAAGAYYTTDLTISSPHDSLAYVTLKFLGHDADGRSGREKGVFVEARASITLRDVLGTTFGLTEGYGAILIEEKAGRPIAAVAQTSTPGVSGGTFGQSVPAFGAGDLIGASPRSIPGVREDARFRTNLILANAAELELVVDVKLVGKNGEPLGTKSYTLPPLGMTQVTRVVRDMGMAGEVTSARLELSTETAGGLFAAYASAIDNVTNDPRTLLP